MLRLRGAGCAGSKQEPSPRLDPAPALPKKKPSILVAEPELVKLAHSDDFATQFSPLFTEYLSLLREVDPALKPDPVTNITPKDALLVIDMQADFVPKSHTNKTGGRFGVPEGDHIVPSCTDLIRHFSQCGARVVATRDYHPIDHVSFVPKGPFPAHCIQGTPGACFLKPIAKAMADCMREGGDVAVAFKGMHEDIDSFGAMPYYDGGIGASGEPRISRSVDVPPEAGLPTCMGCAAAPWTGSLIMKQSALAFAKEFHDVKMDFDAPPDVFACLGDKDRGLMSLQEVLRDRERIFVCGLALDFCVLDTCCNAAQECGADGRPLERQIYMVLDAARAAHIAKIGGFGSGFLSNPSDVLAKLSMNGIKCATTEAITGEPACGVCEAGPTFPDALGPLPLANVHDLSLEVTADSYRVVAGPSRELAELERLCRLTVSESVNGLLSPRAPLPENWPGAPKGAEKLCWAYPVPLLKKSQTSFLAVSTSPTLMFVAYGGFLLLGKDDSVLAVQAIANDTADHLIDFGSPRVWRDEFTPQLQADKRFEPVTLPWMQKAGASEFCWLNPNEVLSHGPETWQPSVHGAFLYLMADGHATYFPAEQPLPAEEQEQSDWSPRLSYRVAGSPNQHV